MRRDWPYYLLAAAWVAALLTAIGAGSIAFGHEHGQVAQWLQQQRVPEGNGNSSGFSCCNDHDVDEVEEDIRDGHYWIKGGHFPEWTEVPDSLVIREPNRHGQPVVWWMGIGPYSIRCFAPGGLT